MAHSPEWRLTLKRCDDDALTALETMRMGKVLSKSGRHLATYLNRQRHVHGPSPALPGQALLRWLVPGDVLLVEGHSRISTAIKYLTQSTWSHASLYVGPLSEGRLTAPGHCFVEADIVKGVRSIGVDEYAGYHTRICRPVGLNDRERQLLIDHVVARIGNQYDLRNIFDLLRYLLPTPPVPARFRRRMIALGSGEPTRAICSTLIAEAFQSIRYPILPTVEYRAGSSIDCPDCEGELLHIRHHSLFAPRDFDVSPYFQIIKPMIEDGFDFRMLKWEHDRAA